MIGRPPRQDSRVDPANVRRLPSSASRSRRRRLPRGPPVLAMSSSAASYDVTLSPSSPLFDYAPTRDGAVDVTWNASYTGMSVWPQHGEANPPLPNGRQYRRTHAAENIDVRLRFRGTGFALCHTPNDAQYSFNLDSKGDASIEMARGDRAKALCGDEPEEVAFASNLHNEEHEVVLSVSASPTNEYQFWGGKFTLSVAGDAGLTAVRADTIDDQAEGWKFVDAPVFPWDGSFGGRTLYNTTHTFNCGYISNITMSRTFTGAGGVVVLGNVWQDSHAFSLALDGEPIKRMDASSAWEDGQTVFFAQGGLDVNTAHTITVLNFNEDRPSCPWEELVGEEQFRFCCTGLDALVLLHAVEPSETSVGGPSSSDNPSKGSSSSSSIPIGAVAGGVIGGVVVVALLGMLSWFLLRRHRRSKRPRPTSVLASELSPGFSSAAPTAPWSASSPSAAQSQRPAFIGAQGYNQSAEKSPAVFASPNVGSSVGGRPLPPPPGAGVRSPSSDKQVLQASESTNPPARLTETDMHQVLQYVATRLDRDQPPPPTSPTLPQYPGLSSPPQRS